MSAPLESVDRHDPEVNRRFEAIMGHEDNADVVRMLTMGLATVDAAPAVAEPSPEDSAAKGSVVYREHAEGVDAGRQWEDAGGNIVRLLHSTDSDDDDDPYVALYVNGQSAAFPLERVEHLIEALEEIRRRGDGRAAA